MRKIEKIENKKKTQLSLVLLAAGEGRRFGSNKLLSQVGEKPMYQHIVDEIESYGKDLFEKRIIVTQYDQIAHAMEQRGYEVVRNLHPEKGISWSLRLGLLTAKKSEKSHARQAVCFAVCDQPYLRGRTIRCFLENWMESGKGLGCLGFHGSLGNPAVFSENYFSALERLEGDKGGKGLIALYPEDLYVYQAEDGKELEDIDRKTRL
ncbi:nucleotidyltransferase family protein [Lachnospiraceae bacterium 62-35]